MEYLLHCAECVDRRFGEDTVKNSWQQFKKECNKKCESEAFALRKKMARKTKSKKAKV